jgi:hypothetical protein
MNILFGRNGNLAFYGNDSYAVVLDTSTDIIVASGESSGLVALASWSNSPEELSTGQKRLCETALGSTSETLTLAASGRRMYSIPEGVQKEAKKALEWRKEYKRGGTPVGLNTARTLAKGGQIGLEKIRHIAKYFPRHEVDKKGKGWGPGEDKFPSNGRIAWALWGGDAAWRWARVIVERENKKAMTAGAAPLDPFKAAYELEDNYAPEFMARVHLDGSGIDRLYKVEAAGEVKVWDDGDWDNLGSLESNVWAYDADLDGDGTIDHCTHVMIDVDSAILIAARLSADPFKNVRIEDLDADEAVLVALGMAGEDWELVDRVMSVAGQPVTAAGTTDPTSSGADADGDGRLDPSFLSEKAKDQPRDAGGKFVKVGSRTVVGGDYSRGKGVISKIDYDNNKVEVLLDNGKLISVPPEYLNSEEDSEGEELIRPTETTVPLNLSGILAEPRTPHDMPKAQLPGTLPPLSKRDLQDVFRNWDGFVANQRASFLPAKGVRAAATKEEKLTPDTTDVIKYLAVVSPDDVQAVMDMVAIVPETKTTTAPVTYRREDGKWVEDPQVYKDLTSPAPPPVVALETKEIVQDVLKQVDDIKQVVASAFKLMVELWSMTSKELNESLIAAGGLDRNRGNAEALRRYWVRGEGAAKIRWGQPGDWKRCVRYLSKHLGPRAKGYCQLRHKEALGYYTATHAKKERRNG